jgi:hypothetical protein
LYAADRNESPPDPALRERTRFCEFQDRALKLLGYRSSRIERLSGDVR